MIVSKAKYTLVARCSFDNKTGVATYENYSKYYPKSSFVSKKKLFKLLMLR